jgi:hypothetical protein
MKRQAKPCERWYTRRQRAGWQQPDRSFLAGLNLRIDLESHDATFQTHSKLVRLPHALAVIISRSLTPAFHMLSMPHCRMDNAHLDSHSRIT